MTVIVAVAVLVGVLALATLLGLLLRAKTGRARTTTAPGDASTVADLAPPTAFGTRATLVQFSTPTCARCPATARHLDSVAARHDGVTRLEIDLAEHPSLASRFNVLQTPTVLLVDGSGTVRTRFGGPPRPPELAAALDTVLTAGTTGTTGTADTTGNQESR
ncbi:thioredoxin family protein [Curtobacterium flaccumfaciens pv. flaccumfaciens]|uniref:TlpA family protein disulfide reductase n=1 Tax=Curtobacterium flaccumfaciens TaxID=2035 RepID=UPI00217DC2FA|nr:thioredoxin family protein [Curtobacterium flaccumfaciens]MCS6551096.1 thioredoxin family protein [Curtobacterium flaccumfaciens pv. flaccumfaciens]